MFNTTKFEHNNQVKSNFVNFYKKVYTSSALESMTEWINKGHIESGYYFDYFSNFIDIKKITVTKIKSNKYLLRIKQYSCYNLELNPLRYESIIKDYKVVNLSQTKFNNWLKNTNPADSYEICMKIEREAILILDSKKLIDNEMHNTIQTYIELKHNKYEETQ